MKKLLVILLMLATYRGFSQIEWAPIGAKWYVSVSEGTLPPNQGYILYEVTKDTVLAETKVKVISKTHYHSNGNDVSPLKSEYTYEKDSIIYYWKNGQFYVLYNFRARPGEKWTVYGTGKYQEFCNYESVGTVIVDSVSTINVNGRKLKAIYTSPYQNSNWSYKGPILETIGNINHLMPKGKECAVDIPDDEGQLRCYEDSKLGLFKTDFCLQSNCSCNELKNYTSISTTIKKDSFFVYPNPVKNNLMLQFLDDSLLKSLIYIELYDINGARINSFKNTDNLYVGTLKDGYYILKLVFTDHKSFIKIIKH